MSETDTGLTTSDEELIANARSGDQGAFAELWRRHYRSGARVARQFTSSIDADDLVSEAYTRIYQRVLAGGGPSGAFRPYLYTTIRNLASTWGAKSRDIQVDDIADYEDPSSLDDPVAIALDRTLTARAFRSLPERWQSVLWYTEVEGMDPHEVAPILGMSANGVAALSYRAREGLRKAWLQAHVSEPGTSETCKWTMSRLGDHARHSLTTRELEKINDHLLDCAKCAIISEEVDEVGSHLAMVMLPILLGAGVGGILLASLTHATAASAATVAASALPAVPASFTVLAAPAAFAPAVTAGLSMGAATGMSAVVGSLAVAAAIGGAVALGLGSSNATPPDPQAGSSSQSTPSASSNSAAIAALTAPRGSGTNHGLVGGLLSGGVLGDGVLGGGVLGGGVLGGSSDGDGSLGGVVSGVTNSLGGTTSALGNTVNNIVGGVTTNIVSPLVGAVTPGASPTGQAAPGGAPVTTNISLSGKGTPGATVAAQAGGIVYATAKVNSQGKFTLLVTALPSGSALQLSQTLTLLGITLPLTIPLSLDTGPVGTVIKLLN
ncbi:MAG TPA: sigma-70 family RNA polymerase sigma factor [Galbitalea sp.]|jgi:RNA polymerase sigma factor (sigma-70 family)|nr:sigma-70 family RNA polymerase sigma factor [Galbitalea sp.]